MLMDHDMLVDDRMLMIVVSMMAMWRADAGVLAMISGPSSITSLIVAVTTRGAIVAASSAISALGA